MTQVTMTSAKANLSQLIKKALLGEEIIISKNKTPLVRLVPLTQHVYPRRTIGLSKGLVQISDDFNEPLDDFQ